MDRPQAHDGMATEWSRCGCSNVRSARSGACLYGIARLAHASSCSHASQVVVGVVLDSI